LRAGLPQAEHPRLTARSSTVPAHWAQPFARLAEELELVETDLEAAILRVRNFVSRILSATS
jgi:hypothetical protein